MAEEATGYRQEESLADGIERDPALVELESQLTVLGAYVSEGFRGMTVEIQKLPDIVATMQDGRWIGHCILRGVDKTSGRGPAA